MSFYSFSLNYTGGHQSGGGTRVWCCWSTSDVVAQSTATIIQSEESQTCSRRSKMEDTEVFVYCPRPPSLWARASVWHLRCWVHGVTGNYTRLPCHRLRGDRHGDTQDRARQNGAPGAIWGRAESLASAGCRDCSLLLMGSPQHPWADLGNKDLKTPVLDKELHTCDQQCSTTKN